MRLLDLFCGAGGAAMGYHRAGFDEIVGVDIKPQPRYPFTFVQGDALTFPLDGFDAVHASPGCQGYTSANRRYYKPHPLHIGPIRARLQSVGVPWVIENVEGARPAMPTAICVCGGAMGLRTWRHRLFDSNVLLFGTEHDHTSENVPIYGPFDGRRLWTRTNGSELRAVRSIETARAVLGVEWMTNRLEIREAIPPAYTEYIGKQLLDALKAAA